MEKPTEKLTPEIPIINGDFKPSMLDISRLMDFYDSSEDPELRELGAEFAAKFFDVLDLYHVLKDRAEIATQTEKENTKP